MNKIKVVIIEDEIPASRAFQVNSIDYLLKPLRQSRLEEAIVKFEQRIPQNSSSDILNNLLNTIKQQSPYRQRVVVSGKDKFFPVSVEHYSQGKAIVRVNPNTEHIITISRDRVSEFRSWLNQ